MLSHTHAHVRTRARAHTHTHLTLAVGEGNSGNLHSLGKSSQYQWTREQVNPRTIWI